MSGLSLIRGRNEPRYVAIRWQLPGDGDVIRQIDRPMRAGIDPLREARSLAQTAGIPRGSGVAFIVYEIAIDAVIVVDGKRETRDVWLPVEVGQFEHGR